jgi:hypothetical protein
MNIVVLSLESSTARRQRCNEIFAANGITDYSYFLTKKEGYKNAIKDFLLLLEQNRGSDLMFFEDDFELVNGWEDIFYKAKSKLPGDWDMLYLGANLQNLVTPCAENLVRVWGAWMLHSVMMRKKFIDYVLRKYEYPRLPVFDEWCRVIAPMMGFYMTYPMISYQRAGYSDYVGKEVDYKIFENKYYKAHESFINSTRIPTAT